MGEKQAEFGLKIGRSERVRAETSVACFPSRPLAPRWPENPYKQALNWIRSGAVTNAAAPGAAVSAATAGAACAFVEFTRNVPNPLP